MHGFLDNGGKVQLRMSAYLCFFDTISLISILLTVATFRWIAGGDFSLTVYFSLSPVMFLFPLFFALADLYPGALLPPQEELKRVCITVSSGYLVMGTITFFSRDAMTYSRSVFFVAWIISMGAIPLVRTFVRTWLSKRGEWGIPAVLVGTGSVIDIMARNVRLRPRIGLRIVGVITDDLPVGSDYDGIPVLSGKGDMQAVANRYPGCYAIVSNDYRFSDPESLIPMLDAYFSRILLLPKSVFLNQRWAVARDVGGMVGLEMKQNLLDGRRMAIKRLLDVTLAGTALLLAFPAIVLLAVLIRLDSRGGVFYGHPRIGREGRTIRVWKFRTMVRNGDDVLKQFLAENADARAEWEATQKLKFDPRVTRLGRFLRKTSLDELPQLWNVVLGELSLVGPRPIVESEKDKYKESYEFYKKITPGITGLWQISGRNLTTYDERINLDLYYVRNWSVWFDIYILLKTIPVVVSGYGAF